MIFDYEGAPKSTTKTAEWDLQAQRWTQLERCPKRAAPSTAQNPKKSDRWLQPAAHRLPTFRRWREVFALPGPVLDERICSTQCFSDFTTPHAICVDDLLAKCRPNNRFLEFLCKALLRFYFPLFLHWNEGIALRNSPLRGERFSHIRGLLVDIRIGKPSSCGYADSVDDI